MNKRSLNYLPMIESCQYESEHMFIIVLTGSVGTAKLQTLEGRF
jgi:hypothetical protein